MNAPRDFNADKAMSDQPDVVESIKSACHAHWPELLSITRAHNLNDRLGCDYWLEFPGGMESLDVKVRQTDYGLHGDDRIICLELESNVGTGKVGWTLDPAKLTDWIAFHYIESNKTFFYHARELRAAVVRFLPLLKETGKPSVQFTGNYESTSLFVSPRDLGAAIYRHSQHTNASMVMP